ncbi:pantoate--beta-alanine ligase [Desulfobacca acetoxidans]|uniref:Pantothenate synthetase n=1 Tax=Desulfobacca acetoxidans (strain ATCC 700848 / DSM 11109 / ASRB2) TaxID=880072 RepID=F2NJ82_DESAR|nr:pantoate--beta-alanine ligase [Desulfobacca acetoxidans]AEB09254.1 Pantothenate synthetase [Desulfobacca acetoxidans DSM 11109]
MCSNRNLQRISLEFFFEVLKLPHMQVIRSPQEMQALALSWRARGDMIVLVPTMGYFHRGHVSLMEYGRGIGRRLVVSLFVNPTQFAPNEDLDCYPRNFDQDCKLAQEAGVDVIFAPEADQLYPPDFQTYVTVEQVTRGLCGASRPIHFRGVATIVLKLFNLVQPQAAIFGEKDYQQLITLKRMALDLNLPVEIIGRPLVREPDGLAMSSRNVYLSPGERRSALNLSRALFKACELTAKGETSRDRLFAALKPILTCDPQINLDYLNLVDPQTLKEIDTIRGQARLAIAAWVGRTRLIDNILLEVP